jgi:hypothetical protein
MNERIKQLAIEANLISPESNGFDPTRLSIAQQKFAELIVRECAGIIESQDVDPSFKLRMSWAVKEYFGVE